MALIETERVLIEEAVPDQIDEIIEIESAPENRDFIWIGTREEHLGEIDDPEHLLLVFKEKENPERTIGYALIHINRHSNIFEIRRIVITDKGNGYGRETMEALIDYAFTEQGINRLWLDVYPDNEIGINLYESLGMHRDGILRENYLADRGYLDQIIYSILRREWEQR